MTGQKDADTAIAELNRRIFMRQLGEDCRRIRANSEELAGFEKERDEWLLGVPLVQLNYPS